MKSTAEHRSPIMTEIPVVVDIFTTCCRLRAAKCQGVVLDEFGAYAEPIGDWVYKCRAIESAGWLNYPCNCKETYEVRYLDFNRDCRMVGWIVDYYSKVPSAQ